MNNYEKLCGKNGELVAFRQKQVLLGAAEIIKRHCEKHKCEDCIFAHHDTFNDFYRCGLSDMGDMPCDWELPTEKTDDFTEQKK